MNHGPNTPAANPYAVNTSPNISPKCAIPKQSLASGADTANMVPRANPMTAVMKKINVHGMAHITGGGLYDNVPRVLPTNVDARFDRSTWKTPAIFEFIEEAGKVDHEEMYRVFNMGIGYVIMVAKKDVEQTMKILKANKQRAIIVGEVVPGTGKSVLIS